MLGHACYMQTISRDLSPVCKIYYTRFHLKKRSKKKYGFSLDNCYLIKACTFQTPKGSLLPPTTKSCKNYFARRMNIEQKFLFS
ncbi:unnamed protein product [Ixodes persulcatus]